jgi:hypothetical protein
MGHQVLLTCIEGGPITQLEAATMGKLKTDVVSDLAKKGVTADVAVEVIGFHEFKRRHDGTVRSMVEEL